MAIAALLVIHGSALATFSICAYDSSTGEVGVAVESRAFNVGMAVPWVSAGAGAIATQASTNESFGPRGLVLLGRGLDARAVLDSLLASDPGRERRQLGVVDARGRSAAFTGSECQTWAGMRTGPGYAIQGNILASEEVVAAMEAAFLSTRGELSWRLLKALEAAQEKGGDRRGQQSAALLVARPSDAHPEYATRYVQLAVDDHAAPIREIMRTYAILEGTDLAEAHLRYAAEYDSAGRPADARRERERVGEALQRALTRSETAASTLNALAWSVATHDLFLDEALAAARRAVDMEPKSAEILDTLAEVHFRRGEIDEAIRTGERALAADPESRYLEEQLQRFRSAKAR